MMKRSGYFMILFAGALGAFLLLLLWYLVSFQSRGGSFAGVMGQMMGNQNAAGMTTAMPGYVWIAALVLLGLALAGVAGLVYFLALPEIKTSQPPAALPEIARPPTESVPSETATKEWSVLLRTSKPEEKRILEVLASHGGRYLQKFIVKEAGLSRLKTHRIVSRLAERGVLIAIRSGNTNEIALAPWLLKDATSEGTRKP
jgi:hypothetical protein